MGASVQPGNTEMHRRLSMQTARVNAHKHTQIRTHTHCVLKLSNNKHRSLEGLIVTPNPAAPTSQRNSPLSFRRHGNSRGRASEMKPSPFRQFPKTMLLLKPTAAAAAPAPPQRRGSTKHSPAALRGGLKSANDAQFSVVCPL